MSHRSCRLISAFIASAALATLASAQQPSQWWLDVALKARSLLINPLTAEQHEVAIIDTPMGVHSPDGKHVAFIGTELERAKAGHDFDLFVADVDPKQPSGKSNVIRLTTDQQGPHDPHWLHDNSTIVFLAESEHGPQVWATFDTADSNKSRMSDDLHPCSQLSVSPTGDVTYVRLNARKQKEQFADLVCALRSEGCETLSNPIVLHDQHISSYAFSPDGKQLAWSGLGSMFIVDLAANTSREIPLHGIHRQLLNHTVDQMEWRPDGKVIAIHCGFLGGIARDLNGDPNAPWPRMFAEDKVFFVPLTWTPSAESLKVGEGKDYPSPTADDPKAEISPSASDESKPWWVRDLPMPALELKWISGDDAKARISSSN